MVRPNEPTRAGEHTTVPYPPTDTLVLSFTVSVELMDLHTL